MGFEDLSRLEEKLDRVLALAPIIEAMGALLVRRKDVNQRVGLAKDTLSKNKNIPKYEEIDRRTTYIKLEDISVVRRRK